MYTTINYTVKVKDKVDAQVLYRTIWQTIKLTHEIDKSEILNNVGIG